MRPAARRCVVLLGTPIVHQQGGLCPMGLHPENATRTAIEQGHLRAMQRAVRAHTATMWRARTCEEARRGAEVHCGVGVAMEGEVCRGGPSRIPPTLCATQTCRQLRILRRNCATAQNAHRGGTHTRRPGVFVPRTSQSNTLLATIHWPENNASAERKGCLSIVSIASGISMALRARNRLTAPKAPHRTPDPG